MNSAGHSRAVGESTPTTPVIPAQAGIRLGVPSFLLPKVAVELSCISRGLVIRRAQASDWYGGSCCLRRRVISATSLCDYVAFPATFVATVDGISRSTY